MIYNYEIHDVFILYFTDFTSINALNLLEECKFSINAKWETLARIMGISLDERHRLRVAISQGLNSETALEETIDMFQRGSTRPVTWHMFISRVRCVDQITATKMSRKLGITATPGKHYTISLLICSFRLGCLSKFTRSISNEITKLTSTF